VLRRVRPGLAGAALAFGEIEMDLAAHRVQRAGRPVQLTPSEFRLLRHLMENPRRVFSREQLLDSVWGRDREIEARTVDVQIRRVRRALNEAGGPDLIRTVRSAGYSLDTD
jgi:two-component system phosphate regulon response regulator PhoB